MDELWQRAGKKNGTRLAAEHAVQRLSSSGWAVIDGLLSKAEVCAARSELIALEPNFHASEIWVGRQAAAAAQASVPDIRGDKILWMCGHQDSPDGKSEKHKNRRTPLVPCPGETERLNRLDEGGARRLPPSDSGKFTALARMLDVMDALALGMRDVSAASNHRLSGIVERSDAMLAVYPPNGACFQAHVDNSAGDGRRLTMLSYLNDGDWQAKDGGALRLHPKDAEAIDILPLGGRGALFFADEMEHEVLSTHRLRFSCNVWYYDREERDRAVDQVQRTGQIGEASSSGPATMDEQAAARSLIQAILSGEGLNQKAGYEALSVAASKLSPKAASFVASAVGVAKSTTPAELSMMLNRLSNQDLQSLRKNMAWPSPERYP